ncbi:MAG: hypothetical protein KF894_32460, partial [Labilithrix sp.]|nr:hypothetical protein [Labilithrix sp.]
KTYCLDDPNNASSNASRKCDAGTRWDATTAKCVECGGVGQTYCLADPNNFASNASRTCNPGLRFDSSSQRCVQ